MTNEAAALAPCPSCHATGRIYNNLDESSNQWFECPYCAGNKLVTYDRLLAYYRPLQNELKDMVEGFKK